MKASYMKFTFSPQPPERPPKKLHLLKKVNIEQAINPFIGNHTPHKYCFQIETGEGSNKAVGRIELLTPRPFSSNICTRETVEGPNSKPVPASQFIRPLLKQTSANPRCVFYAPFTPFTTWGFPHRPL